MSGDCQVALASLITFRQGQRLFLQPYPSIARFSQEETVYRALWAVGKRGYNCQTFNCEHFAAWCCTGVAVSMQSWYSSLWVDPIFPLGWAFVVAKDAGHCALDTFSAEGWSSACLCEIGAGKSASSMGCSAGSCRKGHEVCCHCLLAQHAKIAAAAPFVGEKNTVDFVTAVLPTLRA